MCKVRIVAAAPEDFNAAAELTFMAYHKYAYDIFGEIGAEGAIDHFKKLWRHGHNRFGYHYSYIAKSDDKPVGLMTCYPSALITKLVGPTIRQLICIGKFSFLRHFIVHLNNFYYFSKGAETNASEFYVATLSVLPEYRSKGVGTEMLRYARKLTREQGFKRCTLHVSAENKSGIRFYERNGFSKAPPIEEQVAYFRMVKSI